MKIDLPLSASVFLATVSRGLPVFTFCLALTLGFSLSAQSALAACNMELSVYADQNGRGEINFTPSGELAAVSNSFRLLLRNDVVLDGIVMRSPTRDMPLAMLTYQCPEGDVTGDELAACTIWQGTIYTVSDHGSIDVLPREGLPAPTQVILSELAYAIEKSDLFDSGKVRDLPFDNFRLSGCQE